MRSHHALANGRCSAFASSSPAASPPMPLPLASPRLHSPAAAPPQHPRSCKLATSTPFRSAATLRFRSRIHPSSALPSNRPSPPTHAQTTKPPAPSQPTAAAANAPASSSAAACSSKQAEPSFRPASAHHVGDGTSKLLSLGLVTASMGGIFGSGINLDGPGSTLGALSILALIVTVHECGHFLAARLQGIRVSKFAIGFGPPLFTFKDAEVEYSLRLIPLGGYVAFPDDDPNNGSEFDPDDPDLLKNRSIPERAAVISAGVIANCIFAYLSILVQVGTVGIAFSEYQPGVLIPTVSSNSAAARAGFHDGDLVLTVDGWRVPAAAGQVQDVVNRIRLSEGREMKFQVQRDGTLLDVLCLPDVQADNSGRIGVQIFSNTVISHNKAKDVPDAFSLSTKEFSRLTGIVANGLKQIVTNFSQMAGQLSGPIAIVAAGSDIARIDSAGLFQFCAIININLAAVNVLPLPALDGGFLLLLLLEAVRGGRKLPQELEQGFAASGMLLLTAMGMALVVRDTINLVSPH